MKPVERGYTVVTLNDGTDGNYYLVQNIFRQLKVLKDNNPATFAAFHGLASMAKPMSAEDQDRIRNSGGTDLLEWTHDTGLRATQNAKDVLDLCLRGRNSVMETALRQVFSFVSGKEKPIGFKLISPFKHPHWVDPFAAKGFDIQSVGGTVMKPTGTDIPSVNVVRPALFTRRSPVRALHITG